LFADADLKKLATCEVEGKKYYEGQKIYSKEDRFECICTKDFDSSKLFFLFQQAENEHCRKISCNMEIRYSDEFADGCIPTFFDNAGRCSHRWRCPEETDTIISFAKSVPFPDLKCKFGKLEMNIGDVLSPKKRYPDSCTTCTCELPPTPHCIQTSC